MTDQINFEKYFYYLLICLSIISSINNLYRSPYIDPKTAYENSQLTLAIKKLEPLKPYLAGSREITLITNAGIPLSTLDFPNLVTYYQSQFAVVPTILVSDRIVSELVIGNFAASPEDQFYDAFNIKRWLKFEGGIELLKLAI